MITRIREVRRARGMTLDDVARGCDPPTTPQTIGRLETGTRTVSVGWLNRIALALGVDAQDLVAAGESVELNVAAILGAGGATAPRKRSIVVRPRVDERQIAVLVAASKDEEGERESLFGLIQCQGEYARALNRDVLVPRPAGRFLFG